METYDSEEDTSLEYDTTTYDTSTLDEILKEYESYDSDSLLKYYDDDDLETYSTYDPDYGVLDPSSVTTGAFESVLLATIGAFMGVFLVISAVILAVNIIATWKIMTKAGEQGWKSLIPIYNYWTLFKIAGLTPALSLLLFVPLANLIILIIFYIHLSKAFGKSSGFAVGLIFLNLIFMLILAFGSSTYQGGTTTATDTPNATPEPNQQPNGIEQGTPVASAPEQPVNPDPNNINNPNPGNTPTNV